MPRRRWVGLTVTIVTAATGSSPPGTAISNGSQPAVPTTSSRPADLSVATIILSKSSKRRHCASASSLAGPPNAADIVWWKAGQSSGVQVRISIADVIVLPIAGFS